MRYMFMVVFSVILTGGVFCQQFVVKDDSTSLVISGSQRLYSPSDIEYQLNIYSSPKCGFCRLLKRDLNEIEIPLNVRIIFFEYDTTEEILLKTSDSYKGSEVRLVLRPAYDSGIEIFPSSELIRLSDNKVVKFIKGYRKNYWKKILNKAKS